jgi:hypothetical protein
MIDFPMIDLFLGKISDLPVADHNRGEVSCQRPVSYAVNELALEGKCMVYEQYFRLFG